MYRICAETYSSLGEGLLNTSVRYRVTATVRGVTSTASTCAINALRVVSHPLSGDVPGVGSGVSRTSGASGGLDGVRGASAWGSVMFGLQHLVGLYLCV
jgi:hypothetical protein